MKSGQRLRTCDSFGPCSANSLAIRVSLEFHGFRKGESGLALFFMPDLLGLRDQVV